MIAYKINFWTGSFFEKHKWDEYYCSNKFEIAKLLRKLFSDEFERYWKATDLWNYTSIIKRKMNDDEFSRLRKAIYNWETNIGWIELFCFDIKVLITEINII